MTDKCCRFPLSDHICSLSKDLLAPSYLQGKPSVNLSAAFEDAEQQKNMRNINILHDWPAAPETSLDSSQWSAMQQILTKPLAIIQGPPGTGKTHVSRVALQILIENKGPGQPPIIVAAQTNHALDQLLGHVAKFDPDYIRLGGRSTRPEVKERALFEVRRRDRFPPLPGGLLGKASAQMHALVGNMMQTLSPLNKGETRGPFSARTLFELGVLSEAQAKSLEVGAAQWVTAGDLQSEDAVQLWLNKALVPFEVVYKQSNFGFAEEEVDLEYEQVTELQAEMGVTDEEDIEYLKGRWCPVDDRHTVAKNSGAAALATAKRLLETAHDLWKVRETLRGPMYSIMQESAKAKMLAAFREQAKAYVRIVRDLKVGKWERDAVYLQKANIIGMTTTGLSKYRPLISSLKPKIILIEEAAEVIEAPVAVACVESLEHLILVGDHQQLQGHCSVQELENEPYYLNVSMFERLVRNDMPFRTLLRQRRMDPEFRRLIHPIYPQLEDHPHVLNRPCLPVGLGLYKSFFFTHDYPEYKDSQLSSYNDREAEFVAGFYHYLLQNSADPRGITILTFYNGQRKRILAHLKSRPQIAHHYTNVVTVDSYQGEENGIVILSLVRSNDRGNIGFLEVDNRVCVALSRAQFGFYIFGNGALLSASSPLWNKVLQIMSSNPNRVGNKFPIECKKHGRQSLITYPEDWQQTDGGCSQMCTENLLCGHPCTLKCHPFPHDTMKCSQKCQRTLPCGHQCLKACFEKPCVCECDSLARNPSRTQERFPDGDGPSYNVATGHANSETRRSRTKGASSLGQNENQKQIHNKEVRDNTNQWPNEAFAALCRIRPSPNFDSQPDTFRAGVSNELRGASRFPPMCAQRVQPPSNCQPGAPGDSPPPGSYRSPSDEVGSGVGDGSQHSPEKQTQMRSGWAIYAAGGVREDDLLREKHVADLTRIVKKRLETEAPLIDFDDDDGETGEQDPSPIIEEKIVEMKNGRKQFIHEYQLPRKPIPGLGFSAPQSIAGSSASGESSGQQSLMD